MQEQVNDKTVTLIIKGTKLTGRLLAKGISKLLDERNKQKGQRPASYKGKQTVKQLMRLRSPGA